MDILLATNNKGKIERFKKLIGTLNTDVVLRTPAELGIDEINVVEDGETLADNALLKARAYFGKANMPILANDTGFWVENEGLVEAPKRTALQGATETELTEKQVTDKLIEFWKDKATKNGGQVNAAWVEDFVLIMPDGTEHHVQSRRDIVLTDRVYGTPHPQMPVRCLYISKATNKPSIQHTEKEELLEMQPIVCALKELVKHL
ncbi:MAG: hypothetical protein KAS07_03770 [Candidatus Pacebacteria bacterium]|nr:hypothetical protein [Candidatus Paceibacterota bacterium]